MTRLRLPCLASGLDAYNRKRFDRHVLNSAGTMLKLEGMTSWDNAFGLFMRSDMKEVLASPIAAAKPLHYKGTFLLQEVNCFFWSFPVGGVEGEAIPLRRCLDYGMDTSTSG